MGSVFRKTTTRPVPAGAKISTQGGRLVARWDGKGKRAMAPVVTLPDGRQAIRQESSTYFAKYRDHDGTVKVVPTKCQDKSAAEHFLANLEKRADRIRAEVVTPEEDRRADTARRVGIDQHIDDYVSTLTGNAMHRTNTRGYLERLRDALGWSALADLKRDRLELWLAGEALKKRSARSRNAYRVAASGFCSWLATAGRLAGNPFARLPKASEKADPRRPRRALTPDELGKLMAAAQQAPARRPLKSAGKVEGGRPAERMTGADRADLYLFLAGTGLRVNEARLLRVADLDLDGESPGMSLRAGTTKNKQGAILPLRADLIAMLRRRVDGRRPADAVFNIPADLIRRFHADRKRAGIPLEDDRGRRVDLHSLRTTFGTLLAASGVPLTVAQRLMRHSDPKLTSNIYTDVRVADMRAAIEAMPSVAPAAPSVAPAAPSVAPSVAPTRGKRVQRKSS
ncbi:site-specific tyrosine recombinase XerC [Aquisphaera giovannonii]|uniref:Site-specific tyrosine recombinase XerC n=1 Tax=Aquisphaera giovannonii TaxID=406548 RepID=A0A5B9W128_9BACT|nr:site-specific integrase [Aquisphaera giovannonii]QEH33951.1 site-specific tyrosine recombinase XerC [Aquisphaera giovannonii]